MAFLPLVCLSQKTENFVKANTSSVTKEAVANAPVKPVDGFLITGNTIGYADGTSVALLNGNTGAQETTGVIQKNSFKLAGKVGFPDFKLILINGKQPYITLFIDNSLVTVNAKMDSLEYAVVSGSPSHNEFVALNNIVMPVRELFQEGNPNTAAKNAVAETLDNFINKYPNSYIAPLAIYRHFQLSGDSEKMEQLYTRLNPQIKTSPIGNYVAQQINIAKTTPVMGKPLQDFSQADETGKMISLSSFRGKYVLIDFWASWCRPCRMENPTVVSTYNKYKNKNYTVLGVSFDKTKEPWLDAIKADGLTWTHVSDLLGFNNAVGQQFKIGSIPQNFLIDPKGNLIGKNLRGQELETKLASIFGNN